MKLSIIIPVYNEQATVTTLLEQVAQVPLDKEIIVVDDGSDDGTTELVRGFAGRPGFTILFHERNRGKGRAIRTGLAVATGEVTVVQDADLEYDPMDLPALLAPIAAGRCRVVYGSRRLKRENQQYSGLIYCLGGLLVTHLSRVLFGLRVTDEATCYKMLETELLRSLDLTCERFEFCPEVTAKLARRGIPIHEVPISYYPRHKRDGKKIGWRDAVEAVWTLLKLRLTR